MSYEKQTWKTGDIITAVKLNHMEDGIAEGAGYSVETKAVAVVPEQSVTTTVPGSQPFAVGDLVLAEGITDIPDTLTITFQGQEYVCSSVSPALGVKAYGASYDISTGTIDWSQYPFSLGIRFTPSGKFMCSISTESAGTYTVKATGEQKTVTPSAEFKQAVKQLQPEGVLNVLYDSSFNSETSKESYVLNAPWSEISTALQNGGARLYSHNYYGDSELTTTGTILNAGYSTSQGTKTYTVDAIVIQSSAIKLLHFTTNNQQGTGLTATAE